MKKYLFGLSAVVLALALSSFTIAKKFSPRVTYIFQYQKGTYLKTEVESLAIGSWKVTTNLTCNATNVKACEIEVDQSYTTTNGAGDRILRTSAPKITIIGTASSTDVYYVNSSTSTNIATVNNQN